MGIGGISIWQLLIIFAIIVLIFGTKKLRNLGGDLGDAVKGFKKAVSDEDKTQSTESLESKKVDDVTTQQKDKDKV